MVTTSSSFVPSLRCYSAQPGNANQVKHLKGRNESEAPHNLAQNAAQTGRVTTATDCWRNCRRYAATMLAIFARDVALFAVTMVTSLLGSCTSAPCALSRH